MNLVLKSLHKNQPFQVYKGQEVITVKGTVETVSQDKLITCKDFSIPLENLGTVMPGFIDVIFDNMEMKLTKTQANKIYDILADLGGAYEDDRYSFVYSHTKDKECREWRFCGKFGFGGKYRSGSNTVTCYREDETPERLKLIARINEKLKNL